MDHLKIIQLGVTLANKNGDVPPGTSTWQFDFQFDIDADDSEASSIELLKAVGINFDKHKAHGVNTFLFGEHMFTAGMFRATI